MKIHAGICGSFPRPPELKRAIDSLNENLIPREHFEEIYRSSIVRVVSLQEGSGLDVVTSGLLLWDDLLRPFARKLSGIQLGGLLRFFDNNFYYRRPIIVDRVAWSGPITLHEVEVLSSITSRLVKAVIPGPYTFMKLSENRFYRSAEELVDDLINVLSLEIRSLDKLADIIQIDEPSLVDPELSREDRRWGVAVVNELIRKAGIPSNKLLVATYFHLNHDSYSALLDIKAGLHLDLLSSRDGEAALLELGFEGHLLSLGVVNARSIFPDDLKGIIRRVEEVAKRVSAEELIISTNTWLDYLPFEDAVEKLKILGEVRRRVGLG